VARVEIEDGLLLPRLQPPVSGDQRVVLVGRAVACPPLVELAGGDAKPADESPDGDLGALRPIPDEVDDGIAGIVGNP
jgi:hypothetical protein